MCETKSQQFPHCAVVMSEIYSHIFGQNFRENNVFAKEINKEIIWQNIFSVRSESFIATIFLLKEFREINSFETIYINFYVKLIYLEKWFP